MARILVVEDEPRLRKIIRDFLSAQGYEIVEAGEGLSAVRKALDHQPDAVIMDIMLPGIDGYEAARRIREDRIVPVIMVSAKGEEVDRLKGFEAGSDDYMVKPFSLRELHARLKVVLRRGGEAQPVEQRWSHLVFTVDPLRRLVYSRDKPLPLTDLQYRLLMLLMGRPGVVFSRDDILDRLQEEDHESLGRTVDAHIKNIRKLIEPDPARPRYLLTRWGAGYYFAEKEPL